MKRAFAAWFRDEAEKRTSRPRQALAVGIVALLVLGGCQGSGPGASNVAPSTTSASPAGSPAASLEPSPSADAWNLVALGDSEVTGHGDPTGKGWVPYYADLIREGSGREMIVDNRANDGTTSAGLLGAVRSDADLRDTIARADFVVLGIGGADVEAGDAALAAGPCVRTACYDPAISGYASNIDAIAAEIMTLRAGTPTVLRAITQPNVLTGAEAVIPPFLTDIATEVGVYVARGFNKATCDAMTAHGGACVDVLTAINGPDGKADGYKAGLLNLEDCCYPNEKGHRLIADLLYASGLAPLE